MQNFQSRLTSRLAERREKSLYRQRQVLQSAQQKSIQVDGKTLLNFCSNDYLGLANHPDVVAAFKHGLEKYGAGSGASHLVVGHSHAHHALEEELADFTGRSRALLFSSGFMANVGVLTALLDKGDAVFQDRLNHASLLDGGLFSGARFRRYPHLNTEKLSGLLSADTQGQTFIVSDGVFSMDGDVAPLADLMNLAEQHNAVLMLDDAHGFGCLGSHGGGLAGHVQESGVIVNEERLPILVGTLGKAFGTAGAFVTGSEALIETLIQFCRPYIYTTAMPPAIAEATRTSLRLIKEEGWRRKHLAELIARFRAGCQRLDLPLTQSKTPIQGVLLGDSQTALSASEHLLLKGIQVSAIRPPTVPENSARLRVTLTAEHTEAEVDRLLEALSGICADREVSQ